MLYIGMTRAREELCVSYHVESCLMEELERILSPAASEAGQRPRRVSASPFGWTFAGISRQLPSGHPSDTAITPDDDWRVMEGVFSNGVTGSQAQCFIDLTTIREDLTYAAPLLSLHCLPPPGCVARDQRRQRPASLCERPRRSTAARVLNCRISATSWSKLDRGRRSYANPSDTDDEPFLLWYRVTPEAHPIRHPRHREVRAWQPEKDQVALISSPDQSADSRAEGSTCECRFKAEAPPGRSELILR